MDELVQALSSCASRGIHGILSMIRSLLTGVFFFFSFFLKIFFLI